MPAALAAYEARRRDRVERVRRWGSRLGGAKTAGPVARVARDLVMPRFLALGARPKAMERQAWLFGHHLAWDESRTPQISVACTQGV